MYYDFWTIFLNYTYPIFQMSSNANIPVFLSIDRKYFSDFSIDCNMFLSSRLYICYHTLKIKGSKDGGEVGESWAHLLMHQTETLSWSSKIQSEQTTEGLLADRKFGRQSVQRTLQKRAVKRLYRPWGKVSGPGLLAPETTVPQGHWRQARSMIAA